MTKNHRAEIRSLNLRLTVLRAELATCTTYAMRHCVQESINAALTRIAEIEWVA